MKVFVIGSNEAEAPPHLKILATFQSDIVFQLHDNLDHAIGGEFQNFRVDDDALAIGQGAHFPGITGIGQAERKGYKVTEYAYSGRSRAFGKHGFQRLLPASQDET